MLTETLLAAVAEAVFGYALQQTSLADKVRGWLDRDPEGLAFQLALARAYTAFAQDYPQWTDALFDEHFLKHGAAPILARCLERTNVPEPPELATAWADQLGYQEAERQQRIEELMPVASDFLGYLDAQLRSRSDLQSLFDSRALDTIAQATVQTSQAVEALRTAIAEALNQAAQYQVTVEQPAEQQRLYLCLEATADHLRNCGNLLDAIHAWLLAGQVAAADQDRPWAICWFEKARETSKEEGWANTERKCSLALANLYLNSRDYSEAERSAERALRGARFSPLKAEAAWLRAAAIWRQASKHQRARKHQKELQEELRTVRPALRAFEKAAREYEKLARDEKRERKPEVYELAQARAHYEQAMKAWVNVERVAERIEYLLNEQGEIDQLNEQGEIDLKPAAKRELDRMTRIGEEARDSYSVRIPDELISIDDNIDEIRRNESRLEAQV